MPKRLLYAEAKGAEEARTRAAKLEESLQVAREELESTKKDAATIMKSLKEKNI